METVVASPNSLGLVVAGKDGHSSCHDELVSHAGLCGEIGRVDKTVQHHGLHNASSSERQSLFFARELSDLRREIAKEAGEGREKSLIEHQKTRDLFREQEAARLRDEGRTLRQQLVAAGVVPAV